MVAVRRSKQEIGRRICFSRRLIDAARMRRVIRSTGRGGHGHPGNLTCGVRAGVLLGRNDNLTFVGVAASFCRRRPCSVQTFRKRAAPNVGGVGDSRDDHGGNNQDRCDAHCVEPRNTFSKTKINFASDRAQIPCLRMICSTNRFPLRRIMRPRVQQKWTPVLRPNALQNSKFAHDLFDKPVSTSSEHAPARSAKVDTGFASERALTL